LREHDPVHESEHGYWLLLRYDDVAAAFRDPDLSSEWRRKPRTAAPDDRYAQAQAIVLSSFNMKDDPDHARVRALVQQAFTRAAVDQRRDRIDALVAELLEPALERGGLDLVTELAFPLTITVASEMIGLPVELRDRFRASFEATERLGDPTATAEQRQAGKDALVWQLDVIAEVVDSRRTDPQDDLVTALVRAEEGGNRLTLDEILAALLTMYTAAGTTTERMISSGMLLLLQHPEQWQLLRERPELMNGAVTEILRYHHPNQQTTTPRFAQRDVTYGGRTIPAGATVRLALGAANRDPSRWTDPERFDITRPEVVSLAFGQGAHYCIGAPLARAQATAAFTALRHGFGAGVGAGVGAVELANGGADVRHDPRRMDRYERVEVTFAR
jgi:cytochrome P450